MDPAIQQGLPISFEGPLQITAGVILVSILAALYSAVVVDRLGAGPRFEARYFMETSLFARDYFNARNTELKDPDHLVNLKTAKLHDFIIFSILNDLRDALMRGYKKDEIRITIMIPELRKDETDPALYISHWANDGGRAPITRKMGIGFRMGEGFAGYAWKDGILQSGGKRKYGFLKEVRYMNTSEDQDDRRAFCSIPIYDEGPNVDGRPLLAVLNIDSTKYFYFPFRKKPLRKFQRPLQPYIYALMYHLAFYDDLIGVVSPDSSES